MAAKPNRVSFDPELLSYVEDFALEIGTTNLAKAINQIILDHKRGLCTRSQSPTAQQSVSKNQPPSSLQPDKAEDISEFAGLF
jgi:hypothetical protein